MEPAGLETTTLEPVELGTKAEQKITGGLGDHGGAERGSIQRSVAASVAVTESSGSSGTTSMAETEQTVSL